MSKRSRLSQVGLYHVTLAVEHVADSWDVHVCRVKHAMALINLMQTTHIKRKKTKHTLYTICRNMVYILHVSRPDLVHKIQVSFCKTV